MTAPPRPRIVPAHACRRERWRNEAGWTREILSVPDDADGDWTARLSIAEIESDADYSFFPGMMREQVLLAGDGLRLRFDDDEERLLEPPHGATRFSGERPVRGCPVGRHVQVFNLMWRPDRLETRLMHRPLVGPMLFFCDASTFWAVHVIGGSARFDESADLPVLERGDTALLAAPAGRRFMLDGGADLLLVRFGIGPLR